MATAATQIAAPCPRPATRAAGTTRSALKPVGTQPGLLAEVTWATRHGLAVLCSSGHIPPAGQAARVELLVSQIVRQCAEP